VVLITAYTDTCRIKGLAAGATDFVRKPIDFDELLDKMESILVHTRNESDCSLAFS
jgi:DNA-binding response OmpR family regulator